MDAHLNSDQSAASSSSSSSSSHPIADCAEVADRLRRARERLADVPEVLCPSSCPPSPVQHGHNKSIEAKLKSAMSAAGNDPTHPKWGHVSFMLRTACTSRGYVGAAPGIRIGQGRKLAVDNVAWQLPDTEVEWDEYEKKWDEWTRQRDLSSAKTSKFWPKDTPQRPSKAELVKEKVSAWQAKITHDGLEDPASPLEATHLSRVIDKGKAKDTGRLAVMKQSPLGFVVVKPSTSSQKHTKDISHIVPDATVVDGFAHDRAVRNPFPANSAAQRSSKLLQPPTAAARIGDLSEMDFLPPSFPSQLQTSTPQQEVNGKKRREKPPPIPRHMDISQSPHLLGIASPPFYSQGSHDDVHHDPPRAVSDRGKRVRSLTTEDPGVSYTPRTTSNVSPSMKKARLSPSASTSSSPVPKTPPTRLSRPSTPPHPALQMGEIISAGEMFVPLLPNPRALPTLTELLASSRRTRVRSRQTSRKNKAPDVLQRDTILTVHKAPAQIHAAQPLMTDASPRKTSFSSFASVSSPASPDVVRHRPASLVSPFFTQNSDAFAPPFVSSMHHDGGVGPAGGGGGFLGQGGYSSAPGFPLTRGGSAVFSMGYNSQFDVDGRVDRVSELLDRDVDYSGWLRDIPDDEETPLPAESQSQIGVGHS
ncbi:hypothetical protein CERSUDRAFT_125460 [Gelatoporia subvermispora B]|uniref:Uncharacterized protein n=1 Tax=Ceriporiopsis subvermispora (strain B) TaxID=914234 RepID=M2R789_CERS8|nr:hypothetical protein CERSUDRAFT_125460 [Gelatoporia subvermispora B]